MNWRETFRTGFDSVLGHRLRSGLTILGILIGIAAVILTVGLGEGASASVNAQIAALGSNLLIVTPGSTTGAGGIRGGFGSASTLTVSDANALADHRILPDVSGVAPSSSSAAVLTTAASNWTTSVSGSTPAWLNVRSRTMSEGSFFTAAQQRQAATVAVLGPTTAQELFGFRSPIGATVNINTIPFTVTGVLNSVGSSSTTNQDDLVVVPISTFQQRLSRAAGRNSVSTIYVQAAGSGNEMNAAETEVNTALLSLHHITSPTAADFTVTTQSSIVSTATSVDHTLTILLGGIAGIALLVGGIGVMNIMLVSVTERIREIGLRKALGATPGVIRRQFLVEASVLGLAGGVLGVALGLLGAVILPKLISNQIVVSPTAAVGAIVVALCIGIGFGVYPASRAARLAPIDALRSE